MKSEHIGGPELRILKSDSEFRLELKLGQVIQTGILRHIFLVRPTTIVSHAVFDACHHPRCTGSEPEAQSTLRKLENEL